MALNNLSINYHEIATSAFPELPPKGTSTLILSNHVFSAKLIPNFLSAKRRRDDVNILCNAGFAPYLEVLGLNTIPVKSLEHKSDGNVIRDAWARLIRVSGILYGKYKVASKGRELVENMTSKIQNGEVLWLTPAGAAENKNNQSRWRNGVGELIVSCINQGLDPVVIFAYIDEKAARQVHLKKNLSEVIATLPMSNDKKSAHQIARELQEKFWSF
jgi:hypothetical protein